MGSSILMFVLIIAIFYFFMIRPQQKRQKEIENFRNGLQIGQDVVTSGGIYGKVKAIDNGIVSVEVAHGVVIRFDKSAIYAVGTTQEAK
ncbi:MAG: preprotein translocase subunit YajC [Bacteroidaceae bacterium]|nr:preprotein translocase subunit YajC [Bacteroidaceae bacterium]